jgi:hypothetical protein
MSGWILVSVGCELEGRLHLRVGPSVPARPLGFVAVGSQSAARGEDGPCGDRLNQALSEGRLAYREFCLARD